MPCSCLARSRRSHWAEYVTVEMTPCACLRLCCFRQNQPTRNFVFGRRNGQWVINGKLTPRLAYARLRDDCPAARMLLECSLVQWMSIGLQRLHTWDYHAKNVLFSYLLPCRRNLGHCKDCRYATCGASQASAPLCRAELSATPRVMRAGPRVPSWQLQSWQVALAMAGTPTCMRTARESCQAAWRRAHVSPPSSMTFDNSPHQDTFEVVESAWF